MSSPIRRIVLSVLAAAVALLASWGVARAEPHDTAAGDVVTLAYLCTMDGINNVVEYVQYGFDNGIPPEEIEQAASAVVRLNIQLGECMGLPGLAQVEVLEVMPSRPVGKDYFMDIARVSDGAYVMRHDPSI